MSAAKLLMLQGTASSVGKSLLVAALCRILRQNGYRVAPFKAQNMSNNSFVTRNGGEMGRAQVVQAQAAGIEPHVDMNPILLKPEAEARSQVVLLGKAQTTLSAREYYRIKPELQPITLAALERLRSAHDVVVIEGAGSPAEINLRRHDIVNMGLACAVQAPVLLVGDIDRGGVFAHLVGTLELLEAEERALVKGTIINKFRGDPGLLDDGLRFLEDRTGIPVLGVVPHLPHHGLPEEDSVVLERPAPRAVSKGIIDIAVVQAQRIANFTDFDALASETSVSLRYVSEAAALGQPDVIILPGTKSTVADLASLRAQGIADAIVRLAGAGTVIVGLCGGYQMLGRVIRDAQHVESDMDEVPGLGLLPVETEFVPEKATVQVEGVFAAETGIWQELAHQAIFGYEIHNGVTKQVQPLSPTVRINRRGGAPTDTLDGSVNAAGNVLGSYVHGLFDAPGLRRAFLSAIAQRKGLPTPVFDAIPTLEQTFDRLADHVRASLDIPHIYRIAGL